MFCIMMTFYSVIISCKASPWHIPAQNESSHLFLNCPVSQYPLDLYHMILWTTLLLSFHRCSCHLSFYSFLPVSCISYYLYFIRGRLEVISNREWPHDHCLLDSTPLLCFVQSHLHHHCQGFQNPPAMKVVTAVFAKQKTCNIRHELFLKAKIIH
jgi:hypothetical protein